jgi:hypothetical protein
MAPIDRAMFLRALIIRDIKMGSELKMLKLNAEIKVLCSDT